MHVLGPTRRGAHAPGDEEARAAAVGWTGSEQELERRCEVSRSIAGAIPRSVKMYGQGRSALVGLSRRAVVAGRAHALPSSVGGTCQCTNQPPIAAEAIAL
jgi:hypothetical protein